MVRGTALRFGGSDQDQGQEINAQSLFAVISDWSVNAWNIGDMGNMPAKCIKYFTDGHISL